MITSRRTIPKLTVVGLRLDWQDMALRHTVKAAGGRWNPASGCGSCGKPGWWDSADGPAIRAC